MLIEFSVTNYRSIKDKVSLSLVASSDRKHPGNVFPAEGPGKLEVVKTAAIYGANASGKSNLVEALWLMRQLARHSATEPPEGDRLPVSAFGLDPATLRQPSEFEIVFAAEGERYVYGFAVDRLRVHEEWLTAARKRTRLLFRRTADGVDFGDSWRGDREKLVELTGPDTLLLSRAEQFGNPTVGAAARWLRDGVRFVSDRPETTSEMSFTRELLAQGGSAARLVEDLVREADTGVAEIRVDCVYAHELAESRTLTPEAISQILRSQRADDDTAKPRRFEVVRTRHAGTDGATATFEVSEESSGTQRLFALSGPLVQVLSEGSTLVIDELDTKLHPLLTRALVRAFHRADTGAQLIFTTHDCGLLDSSLFRRDQIWFTEKDRRGATDLYSLWDYDAHPVRGDENFREGYLRGRYGAIPFVGEFSFEREKEQAEAEGR